MKIKLSQKQTETLKNLFENNAYCEGYDTFDINNNCYCLDDVLTDIFDNINNANNNISYIELNDLTDDKKYSIIDDAYEIVNIDMHYHIVDKVNNIEVSTNIYKWLFDIENATFEVLNNEYKYVIEMLKELKQCDINDNEKSIINELIDEINEY